jgi:hypothetical protein
MASRKQQIGAGVVEFALVFLVFLTFVLGLLDFTRLLYTWNAAQEAARAGARYAAVCDDTTRTADVRALMQRMVPAISTVAIDWSPAGCTASSCESLRLRVTGLQFQWISPIVGGERLAAIALPSVTAESTREAMRQDPLSASLCAL